MNASSGKGVAHLRSAETPPARAGARARWLVVLFLVAVLAAPPVIAAPAAVADRPIVVGQPASVLYMDPQYTQLSTERSTYHAVFDPLLEVDESLRPIAHLATQWQAQGDRTWILRLRSGVTFHNGEPFNAEVVKYNVERVLRRGYQRFPFLQFLEKAEVIDPQTVRITTKTPFPMFLARMTQFYMVPIKYTQEVGDQAFNRRPVGTGPWKFVDWVRDAQMRLEANPTYWRGAPAARSLTWRFIPDSATRLSALKTGELSFMVDLAPDDYEQVSKDPSLRALSVESLRTPFLFLYPESPGRRGGPLRDVRVRRAINHAVNVQAIIDGILRGRASRTATLMTPKIRCFDPKIQPYEYNVDQARRLLAEAGFPNGFEIDMATQSSGPIPKAVEIGQAIAADLGRVGIRVQLQTPDLNTMLVLQRRRAFPAITLWSYGGGAADPDDKFWAPYSTEASNYLLFTDEMQQLIARGRSTVSAVQRCASYGRLQQIIKDEAIIVPLVIQHDLYGARKDFPVQALPNQLYRFYRAGAVR